MKKNKIIGLLVATLGAAGCIATASALYTKGAEDISFGIGAKYEAKGGKIQYRINQKTSGTIDPEYLKNDGTNGGHALGGAYTQVHYSFPIGAVFSEGMPAQSYVVGHFAITFSDIDEALVNKSKIWVGVNGYTENTWGESTYATAFMKTDTAVNEDEMTFEHDLAVAASEAQSVEVYFKLDQAITDDLMTLDGKTPFTVSASWGEPTNFEFAYVNGTHTGWQLDDVYQMVPNIGVGKDSFQWMYSNITGVDTFKCCKGDTYSADKSNTDPEDKNEHLDSSKTYNLYWSGSASDNVIIQEVTE